MKRFILYTITLLLITASSGFAADHAFDKGAVRIGGNLFFQSVSGKAYYDQKMFRFTPASTFAIKKGIFVGINGLIESSKFKGDESNTYWAIGPLVEFYLPPDDIINSLTPYLRLFYTKSHVSQTDMKQTGFNIGVMKMLTENIGLDFGVMYTFDKVKTERFVHVPYSGMILQNSEYDGNSLLVGFGIESYIF